MNQVKLLWMNVWMCLIFSGNVYSAEYKLVGLEPLDHIVIFPGHDPTSKAVQVIYSVENNIALMGDQILSLGSHPAGGIEFITWEFDGKEVLLKHLSCRGRLLAEYKMRNHQSVHSGAKDPSIIGARSSPKKEYAAVVSDRHGSSKDVARTVRVARIRDGEIELQDHLAEFQVKHNTSDYSYEYVAWVGESNNLYYSDVSGIVMSYSPITNENRKVCIGEFLGLVPGSPQMLVRQNDGKISICDLEGSQCRRIVCPRKLRDKRRLGPVVLPGGDGFFLATPRFIPLVEDALWYWRSNIDGSDLKRLGGARGYSMRFCFASDSE